MPPLLISAIVLAPLLMLGACSSHPEHPATVVPASATTALHAVAPSTAAPATTATPDTAAVLAALVKQQYPSYAVEEFSAGDLNADGSLDLLVVLRGLQPCTTLSEPTYCRKTLLVLNEGFPRMRVAASNDNVVACSNCGGAGVGDPHRGIIIKGNYFSFESLYGACDKTYFTVTFHYSRTRRNWFLHRRSSLDYSCQDTTNTVDENQESTRDFGVVSFSDFGGVEVAE
ncbi:hypothetical protein [Hymenobacter sp. UYP22]|uniref:hypothetical protein n=1 Tax=Hymenobacter sp. UYP22 TaxID=3156348 RepID=UPI003396B6A8